MTVEELIAKLQALPDHGALVYAWCGYDDSLAPARLAVGEYVNRAVVVEVV